MKKTILITGSTDGIGKLAARKLANEGHRILIHGRSADKVEQTISEITNQAQHTQVEGVVADLSDLDTVKTMATHVSQKVSRLDILINNAGVYKGPSDPIKGGLDLRFTVNYLAPYLLTEDLLPLIPKESSSRIINLSSAAQAPVSLDALMGKGTLSTHDSYAQSKLALTMWSFDLASKSAPISVIPVNPGSLLNTRMVREGFGRHWSPADKGGDILYDLAVSDAYQGITGKYFDNDQGTFGQAHADAYLPGKIDALISATESIFDSYPWTASNA